MSGVRGQEFEICGLTSEVLSMKLPCLLDGLLHGCDKTGYFIIEEQGL